MQCKTGDPETVKPWPLSQRNTFCSLETSLRTACSGSKRWALCLTVCAQGKVSFSLPERYMHCCLSGGPGQAGIPGSRNNACKGTEACKNDICSAPHFWWTFLQDLLFHSSSSVGFESCYCFWHSPAFFSCVSQRLLHTAFLSAHSDFIASCSCFIQADSDKVYSTMLSFFE